MKIDVRFRSLDPSHPLREHAHRRLHFQLGRFGQDVRSVVVRISDENGPRGGVDKRCQVTVLGPRFGEVTVDERSGDAYVAVDAAVARLGRAVGRELARVRRTRGDGRAWWQAP